LYFVLVFFFFSLSLSLIKYIFTAVGRREGINESVAKDVTAVFKGKTAAQLETLQLQIQAEIMGNREGIDIGYWESLLSQLKGKSDISFMIYYLLIIIITG
jgi:hypothetical protein